MVRGGGNKKRFQYCTDPSGAILYLRALQGHSGRNPIDPSLHDNVLIPDNFFEYIYHIGCAINLRSITNSGLIPGGQNLGRERQTVFFLPVNPMDKDHKDPYELDLTKSRLASHKQKKWKRHQDTVYWVDIQLAQRKGLKFCQTRSNAIILYDTLPAYCIAKVVVMECGEIKYENATKMNHKQNVMELTQVWMPAGLACTVFLEPTSRPDDVREHACQSSQNHPGLVLKSLHAPSAGNCSLRAN